MGQVGYSTSLIGWSNEDGKPRIVISRDKDGHIPVIGDDELEQARRLVVLKISGKPPLGDVDWKSECPEKFSQRTTRGSGR